MDGVYDDSFTTPKLIPMTDVTENDIQNLLALIVSKSVKYLIRIGKIKNTVEGLALVKEELPGNVIDLASRAALESKIAFGENAGRPIRKIASGFGNYGDRPTKNSKLCFSMNGFSIHAGSRVNSLNRPRLYELIEYMNRGPLSNDRVEYVSDQVVRLKLKTAWDGGKTTHLDHRWNL